MMDMLSYALALILLIIALIGIVLSKTYYYLPPKELKRQAEQGNKLAATLYQAVAYGPSLRALVWTVIVLASAGGFVFFARIAPWWLGFAVVVLVLWLGFSWLPNTRVTAVGARLAMLCTPVIAWLLNWTHPWLSRLAGPLHHHYASVGHTGLYEADDLLELIERQEAQEDNRISPHELAAIKQALTAHRYKVSDVMVPRAEVKTVSDNDTVGLVLLDELHASGQSSFPVRKGKTDKIIGSLYLHDLNLKTEGKVRDYMHNDVRYLHEDDSLQQALQAFYKTKHQLFVVVNSFEEYVGAATLEHVMRELAGNPAVDDFDQHEDLAAVAGKHAHDDELAELATEPEPAAPELIEEPADTSEPEFEVVSDEAETDETDEEPEPEEAAPAEPVEPEVEEPAAASEAGAADAETEPAEESGESMEDNDIAALNVEDEGDDSTSSENVIDPDSLPALDLPDDDDGDLGEGSHVTFETPKKPTNPKK